MRCIRVGICGAVALVLVGCGSHGGPWRPLATPGPGGTSAANGFVPLAFDAGVFSPTSTTPQGGDARGALATGLLVAGQLDSLLGDLFDGLREQDLFVFVPSRAPVAELISETRVDEIGWDPPVTDTVIITGTLYLNTSDPTYLLELREEKGLDRSLRIASYQKGSLTANQVEGLVPGAVRGSPNTIRSQWTTALDTSAHVETSRSQYHHALADGGVWADDYVWTTRLDERDVVPTSTVSDSNSISKQADGYWVRETSHSESAYGAGPGDPNSPWGSPWMTDYHLVSHTGRAETTCSDGTRWVMTYGPTLSWRRECYGPDDKLLAVGISDGRDERWIDDAGQLASLPSDWYEHGGFVYTRENGRRWEYETYFGAARHFVWNREHWHARAVGSLDETPHNVAGSTALYIPDLDGFLWLLSAWEMSFAILDLPQTWQALYIDPPFPPQAPPGGGLDGGWTYLDGFWLVWSEASYFENDPMYYWDPLAGEARATSYAASPHVRAGYGATWYAHWIPDLGGWLWVKREDVETMPLAWFSPFHDPFPEVRAYFYRTPDDGVNPRLGWTLNVAEMSHFAGSPNFRWNAAADQAQPYTLAEDPRPRFERIVYWIPELGGWLWTMRGYEGTLPHAWWRLFYTEFEYPDLPSGGWLYTDADGFQVAPDARFAAADHYVWQPTMIWRDAYHYDNTPHLYDDWAAYWIPDLNGWLWVYPTDWITVPAAWQELYPHRAAATNPRARLRGRGVWEMASPPAVGPDGWSASVASSQGRPSRTARRAARDRPIVVIPAEPNRARPAPRHRANQRTRFAQRALPPTSYWASRRATQRRPGDGQAGVAMR